MLIFLLKTVKMNLSGFQYLYILLNAQTNVTNSHKKEKCCCQWESSHLFVASGEGAMDKWQRWKTWTSVKLTLESKGCDVCSARRFADRHRCPSKPRTLEPTSWAPHSGSETSVRLSESNVKKLSVWQGRWWWVRWIFTVVCKQPNSSPTCSWSSHFACPQLDNFMLLRSSLVCCHCLRKATLHNQISTSGKRWIPSWPVLNFSGGTNRYTKWLQTIV